MTRTRWRRAFLIPLLAMGLLGIPHAGASADGGAPTVVADGLNNPRGLAVAPDGAIYVAEAGKGGPGPCTEHPILGEACFGRTGAITRIWKGDQERVVRGLPSIARPDGVEAFGPHDVGPVDDDEFYFTMGLAGPPELRAAFGNRGRLLGWLMHGEADDADDVDLRAVADIVAYEARVNPDGDVIDSNPFGLLTEGHTNYVVDAGGNSLLAVDRRGRIRTVAVFPARLVEFQGERIPMHAVPTSVVRGPDGALYVGQLTGFPFPIGGARVYRIGAGGKPRVYARGFTNIVDIAFKGRTLYVLEIAHNSLLAEQPEGALIKVAPNGRRSIVARDLFFPSGVALGKRGEIYVTNCGVCPGEGAVLRIRP